MLRLCSMVRWIFWYWSELVSTSTWMPEYSANALLMSRKDWKSWLIVERQSTRSRLIGTWRSSQSWPMSCISVTSCGPKWCPTTITLRWLCASSSYWLVSAKIHIDGYGNDFWFLIEWTCQFKIPGIIFLALFSNDGFMVGFSVTLFGMTYFPSLMVCCFVSGNLHLKVISKCSTFSSLFRIW